MRMVVNRNKNLVRTVLQLMGMGHKLSEPDWKDRYAVATQLDGCLAQAVSKSEKAQGLFLIKLDAHGRVRWVTDISHLGDKLEAV